MSVLKQKMTKKPINNQKNPHHKEKYASKGFKLIIMSATIESSKFMRFFNTDALINIEGRSYPTEMFNVL